MMKMYSKISIIKLIKHVFVYAVTYYCIANNIELTSYLEYFYILFVFNISSFIVGWVKNIQVIYEKSEKLISAFNPTLAFWFRSN